MQPRNCPLNRPAEAATSTAMLCVAPGDEWFNPLLAQPFSELLGVIATIGKQILRTPARCSRLAAHARNSLNQFFEHCRVVLIGFGHRRAQDNAVAISEHLL